eukprot:TRINITY_DN2414_c0_g1_i2.p1 TRINITY_DN2414_c0_g1~~TRINITY_DN2414_c0_g1_i2.p1  ORF type:complete len:140 (-),score=25.46 TRINITY_DN2414_c0_g1_i2:29-448(-)
MPEKITVRTRRFQSNPLLSRKQMIVEVIHPGVRRNIPLSEVKSELATHYSVSPDTVIIYNMKTKFGGGKTTGFVHIYDTVSDMKRVEPSYRQIRLLSKKEKRDVLDMKKRERNSMKARRERKNELKKLFGKKKREKQQS